ncbi:hypothetical protein ACLOJK_032596 [Asimina triloba]
MASKVRRWRRRVPGIPLTRSIGTHALYALNAFISPRLSSSPLQIHCRQYYSGGGKETMAAMKEEGAKSLGLEKIFLRGPSLQLRLGI